MVSLGGFSGGVMGGASINIVIRGVDKFSRTIDTATTKFGAFGRIAGGAIKGLITVSAIAAGAVAAIGVSSLRSAIDFEETSQKFAVVFQDVSDESEAVAKDLQENFGLSGEAAKRLLGDTGDLLTGFGYTGEAALSMSEDVNKLAVDLASFTNAQGGAEAVSKSLTKALLGERESLKTYGIAILEADVNAEILNMGMENLTGEAMRQAKAQATLNIAFRQSKNAVGDFDRTQDSAANRMRTLKARMEDIKNEIGVAMIPAFQNLLTVLDEKIIPAIEPLIPMLGEALADAIVFVAEKLGEFGEWFIDNKDTIIDTVKGITSAFGTLYDILKPVAKILGEILGMIIDVVSYIADSKVGALVGKAFKYSAYGWEGLSNYASTGQWDDFISRPGQPAARFSPDDTIIGVKNPSKLGGKGGIVVQIQNVNGLDANEVASSLQKQLRSLITT